MDLIRDVISEMKCAAYLLRMLAMGNSGLLRKGGYEAFLDR